MTGWITDLFLLGWGALSWNTRKTWHLLRGRRRRCPCQVASDSGRAYETGCEAVTHFRSPGRFRAVCPLLKRRSDGAWVCSVDAGDVRPFWGRAVLLLAGGGLASYLLATLAALGLLVALGYQPAYRQVFWPRAWRELRVVQAKRYLEKAREARAAGRPAEALFALSNAYELNPRDYTAGFLLAQLWQGGQPMLSDGVFARLYREHPGHHEQTAQAWYRALLARGDFPAIVPLALDRLLASGDAAPSPAWTQALLFAARRVGDSALLPKLLEAGRLPPEARELLEIEHALSLLTSAERVQTLTAALADTRDPFSATHLLRRLLEEKRPDLVLAHLTRPDSLLDNREKIRLQLDALADLGRSSERAALLRQILAQPATPVIWELLSSHLIARPAPGLLRLVAEKHQSDPLPPGDAAYPQLLAWFAACGVHGDPALVQDASRLVATATARDSRAMEIARQAFLSPPAGFRLETILPLLQPLPLEAAYALYDHYAPPPPYPN